MSWKPFEFGVTELLTLDNPVGEGGDRVYSTAPKRAVGIDGIDYYVKGPAIEIVFAEVAGCVIADAVGLAVPCARVCTLGGLILAGTRKISEMRVIDPFLSSPHRVSNHQSLFEAVVVDIWLGNTDRNMGNIVMFAPRNEKPQFVFIDFEKSVCLREFPTVKSAMIAPGALWPTYDLGAAIRPFKPLHPPATIIDRIEIVNESDCMLLLKPVSDALGGVLWLNDTVATLSERAAKIRKLVTDVWI